jgi:transposase
MAGLSKEFLAERDLRIFKMRQAGVSINEIARRFGISVGACSTAIQRQLQKLNKEALMAYPEVLRMELERLDALQQAVWPMTQHRKVTLDDGTEVTAEPDLKAIQQVLAIMDRRSKLLGMEQTNVSLTVDTSDQPARASLAGADAPLALSAVSAEEEARKLLSIMGAAGVLPSETVQQIIGESEAPLALPAVEPREERAYE